MTTIPNPTSPLARAAGPVAAELSRSPTWADLRAVANRAAAAKGEWGGAPIPVDHVELVMEPRYPFKGAHGMRWGDRPAEPVQPADYQVLNSWRCHERGACVYVCREADGKSRAYLLPDGSGQRLTYWMNTLGVFAGHVWDAGTEDRALAKLRQLVSPHAFDCYRTVGGFLETSKRSGVTYLFRKLRPTIAMRPGRDGAMRVLTVLCLHPLGYYAESWAGVMCPTDDVVAHLMMMRASEHQFWKKANHHPMGSAAAGI